MKKKGIALLLFAILLRGANGQEPENKKLGDASYQGRVSSSTVAWATVGLLILVGVGIAVGVGISKNSGD